MAGTVLTLSRVFQGRPVGRRVAVAVRAARPVVAIVALLPVVAYVVVAIRRLGYPYELEWLEGGAVEMVRRVVDGQSLYVAPSIHYVAYPYTPLYFWVSAAVAHVTGVGFLPLRLVSFLSSLGCLALLFHLVRRQTGDLVAGLVAAGLFAATYKLCLAWFDIGRVDSLALFLVLATIAAARHAFAPARSARPGRSRTRDLAWGTAAGALAFGAFFSKQSGLVAVMPVLVILSVRRPWAGLPALATVGALVAASTGWLDGATHGWYGWFVFDELTRQGVNRSAILRVVPDDVLGPLSCAVALAMVGFAYQAWRRRDRGIRWFWAMAAAGMVASSYLGELHSGGAGDVLMPAFAGAALLAGLGYGWLAEGLTAVRSPSGARQGPSPSVTWFTLAASGTLLGLVVAQVAMLRYNPAALVPARADAAAGRHFVALVASRPGEVLVYDHPWYETMAGKPSFAQGEAVHDVLRAGPSIARTDLLASIDAAFASPRLTTVFVDGWGGELDPWLDHGWRRQPVVFTCTACFYSPSDLQTRPALEFIRSSGTSAIAPTTSPDSSRQG